MPRSSSVTMERRDEWSDQDVLVIAATAATAVLWPVGLVLAWACPRWRFVDKVIATVLPLTGLILSLVVLPAGQRALGLSAPSLANRVLEVAHFGGLLGAPLLASLFLGVRAHLSRRLLAGLLLVALVVLGIGQLAFFLGTRLRPGGV